MTIDFSKYGTPTATATPNSTAGTKQAATSTDFSKYGTPTVAGMTGQAQNISTQDQVSAQKFSPTFAAKSTDSAISGALKTVGNIPSSAVNFGKGLIDFFNPVNTVKTAQSIGESLAGAEKDIGGIGKIVTQTAKEIPGQAYSALVPTFLKELFAGDTVGARRTIENDPVGQILPILMVARGAAEKAGMGAEFDSAVSTIAKPVTKTASIVGNAISSGAGSLASQILGASTGTGASTIKEGFGGTQAFVDAMRGKIDPEAVVRTAQDAVQNIAEQRRAAYAADLQKIGENTQSLDISPVLRTLDTKLKNFGVRVKEADGSLDFSRSSIANNSTARADVQAVYNTLKSWGTQPGDRTPLGLDTLKKQLGDSYSESGNARAFVQGVKSEVSNILNKQVPGYAEMTKQYQSASNLLDDIKSATSIGGNAKVDTIFTKLTTAMKGDKELRLEIMKEIQSQGAQPDLMAQIAGINMQSFIPKGIVGRMTDISAGFGVLFHYFNPQVIPALLATSPRVVGEFVRGLGLGATKTKVILDAINKIPNRLSGGQTLLMPQANPNVRSSIPSSYTQDKTLVR